MADRYDRDYDRDRSQWRERDEDYRSREWENEAGWARSRENSPEFGGSTRRGWGRSQDYERDRENWAGRTSGFGRWGSAPARGGGYSPQFDDYTQDYGYGRGGLRDRDAYDQDYGQGTRMNQGMGRGYGQRGRTSRWGQGREYGTGMRRGQGWPGQGTSQNWPSRGYDRGWEGQRYNPGWQGQGYGQTAPDWQDDFETGFEEDLPVTFTYTEYWLVPGPYAGVGPQDYARSPERLREDIIQRLTQHGQLNAANIQVEVGDNCEVTLTGQVDNRQAKRLAEDAAESVWGVNDVHNQLRVRKREGSGSGSQGQAEGDGQTATTRAPATRGKGSKA